MVSKQCRVKKNLQQYIDEILDYVLDTNGARDMNFDFDDSEANENYNLELEREPVAIQNPQQAKKSLVVLRWLYSILYSVPCVNCYV